jgi:Zn-dependent peptidase ImmA (M78 family)
MIEKINDLIDLTEWKTRKQINEELRVYSVRLNERTFRKNVESHNELYFAHEKEFYVAHGSKGYKMTKDTEEIRESLRDSLKRGLDQLSKYHKGIKALGENANFSLRVENDELVFMGD